MAQPKPTIPRVCVTCRSAFLTWPFKIKQGRGNYCRFACYNAARKRPPGGPWTCSRCRIEKPVEDFPLHGNGFRDTFCKACHYSNRRTRYANDPAFSDSLRQAAKDWYAENKEARAAYGKAYRAEHPEITQRAVEKYRSKHPERYAAHVAVALARRTGQLAKQPCRECGDSQSYAHHHHGYAPEHHLDVVWLCRPHHRLAHPSNTID